MSELRWKAAVGGRTFTGEVDAPDGTVRIRCDAPAGTIQKITAVLPWKMGEDKRLFMNGYQIWTYCPEYRKRDKIRGLAHVNALLGGVLLTSDDPARYSPAAREQYCALREMGKAENVRVVDGQRLAVRYELNGKSFEIGLDA